MMEMHGNKFVAMVIQNIHKKVQLTCVFFENVRCFSFNCVRVMKYNIVMIYDVISSG